MPLRNLIQRITHRSGRGSIIEKDYYLGEGLESFHNQEDLLSEEFRSAYQAAVSAVGDDYQVPQRMRLLGWAGKQACLTNPGLAFVELGTGKGFSMLFVLSYLKDLGFEPDCLLFDTFNQDLSDESKAAGGVSAGTRFYADSFEEVQNRFSVFGSCKVIMGKLPDSLGNVEMPGVGFVHVDLNDGVAEVMALRRLWPLIASGCPIVLDDFANRGRASQQAVVSAFFDELGIPVLSTPQGQGLVIKP